ncbi:hypothetical protein [uncultured Clostridium sp.]|uniref:hypothetical protein n=1 Tax=uncultured Clostridium sp. TaxID=59620 RepID=UPI002625093C|nr:hypothetical protein [uncultured Clostridium sp.]
MKNRKEAIFSIIILALVIGGSISFLCIENALEPFEDNMNNMTININNGNVQGVNEENKKTEQSKSKDTQQGNISEVNMETEQSNERYYEDGVAFFNAGRYKYAIKNLELIKSGSLKEKAEKDLNLARGFVTLQQCLQNENKNKASTPNIEAIYNEGEFINDVQGYKKLYDEPHQLFLVNGTDYYLVTENQIYEVRGSILENKGKPTL